MFIEIRMFYFLIKILANLLLCPLVHPKLGDYCHFLLRWKYEISLMHYCLDHLLWIDHKFEYIFFYIEMIVYEKTNQWTCWHNSVNTCHLCNRRAKIKYECKFNILVKWFVGYKFIWYVQKFNAVILSNRQCIFIFSFKLINF